MADTLYDTQVSASSVAERFGGRKSSLGYRFRCPVHDGKSPDNFVVWNDRSRKLRFKCHSRGCGDDNPSVVYEALGLVKRVRGDGTRAPQRFLYCDPAGPSTIWELRECATWIAVADKRPLGFRHDGGWIQWQSTIPAAEGGLSVARYGGVQVKPGGRRWRVPEWTAGQEVIDRLSAAGIDGGRPALAQTGSEEHPAPHSVGVIDVDYKPDGDPDGSGMAMRDEYVSRMRVVGMPVLESGGGNGFHGLFRSPRSGEWVDQPYAYPRQSPVKGLRVEVFPAGRAGAVTLHFNRRVGSASHIPSVSARGINALIKTRRRVGHTYDDPEACECMSVHCVVCGGPREVGMHGWRCFGCAERFLHERYPDRFDVEEVGI